MGGSCGNRAEAGPEPRIDEMRRFPRYREKSGIGTGAIWVVPRIFPSHRDGEVLFFCRLSFPV